MKNIKHCAAAIAALALTIMACSKKSNNNNGPSGPVGTAAFTFNGQTDTMTSVYCDTSHNLYVQYRGSLFSSTNDTAELQFSFANQNPGPPWVSQIGGLWSCASATQKIYVYYRDIKTNIVYYGYSPFTQLPSAIHPFLLNVSYNNGSIFSATFSGEIYDQNSGKYDSLYISKGFFTVQLK